MRKDTSTAPGTAGMARPTLTRSRRAARSGQVELASGSTRVLVVGGAAQVLAWTEAMPPPLVASMAFVRSPADVALAGRRGAFAAHWRSGSAQLEGQFDLVLDLCDPPLIAAPLRPEGYFAPGAALPARADVLASLLRVARNARHA